MFTASEQRQSLILNDPLKNEESADDLTTTSQQFTESEDLSHPKKLYRSRKILCFGLLGFFVFVLFVVVISLVLLMRTQSVLHDYQIYPTLDERPQWWINAMKEAQVLSTQRASPLLLWQDENKNYLLWIFDSTLVNTTQGIRNLTNAAMFLITDRKNPTNVTTAYFLKEFNDTSQLRPLIPLTNSELQQKMQIALLGSISLNGNGFLYFDILNQNNIHSAYGLASCTFHDQVICSRVFSNNTESPVAPNALILDISKEFVYAYVLRDRLFNDSKNEVYIARLPNDGQTILDSSMPLKFWKDADLWQSWLSAHPLAYDNGESVDVIWCPFLQSYLLLDSGFSGTLRLRTAPHPYGQWSDAVNIYTYPGFGTLQSAYFHPEFFEQDGRVMYITFSVRGNPYELYPQWLKIVFHRKSDGGIL